MFTQTVHGYDQLMFWNGYKYTKFTLLIHGKESITSQILFSYNYTKTILGNSPHSVTKKKITTPYVNPTILHSLSLLFVCWRLTPSRSSVDRVPFVF